MSWELHKAVCIIQWSEFGKVPFPPLLYCWWTMTEMSSALYPLGVKNGDRLCSVRWSCRTCHRMSLKSFPPTHKQVSGNHLPVLACRDATSSTHQSSSLRPGLFLLHWITGVSSRPAQPKAPTGWGIFWHAACYAKRFNPRHVVFCSQVA